MLVNMNDILPAANQQGTAIASFNTFGIEYADVCIASAEQLNMPVILAINKDMANYTAIESYAALLVKMAEASSAQICIHLDHCDDLEQIGRALDAGLPSVMYDGSQLPLQQNIDNTGIIVQRAAQYSATVEAELGSVPYFSGRDHIINAPTDVDQVAPFCEESGCDALAVSVGNVHRLTDSKVVIDYQLLRKIEQQASVPLVIHGASGIDIDAIHTLATTSSVAKFNIGTALRLCWYQEVEKVVASKEASDTLDVMTRILPAMQERCVYYMSAMTQQQSIEE